MGSGKVMRIMSDGGQVDWQTDGFKGVVGGGGYSRRGFINKYIYIYICNFVGPLDPRKEQNTSKPLENYQMY